MTILHHAVYKLIRKPILHCIQSGYEFLLLREKVNGRTTDPKDYKGEITLKSMNYVRWNGLISINLRKRHRVMNVPSTMQDQKINTINVYSDPSFVAL